MTTIQIEAQISAEQLLRAVAQLPPHELETFTDRVLALRAQRAAPRLSQQETTLLLHINRQLSEDRQRRYDELVARRQEETISPSELQELIELTEQSERHDAERLAALTELAQVRGMTVPALMTLLGITPRPYA